MDAKRAKTRSKIDYQLLVTQEGNDIMQENLYFYMDEHTPYGQNK
jgi:hypothetical protein